MDGLRKLVSGRLRGTGVSPVSAAGPHPNADVLAAFAENALLDADRAQLLQHLGACKDCRDVLYLAAPNSAEAQAVLSFPPKRRFALMFRWGALAASIVIVGAAVITNFPTLRRQAQAPAAAKISGYAKVAEEKTPAEVEPMRDRFAPEPAPELTRKDRPAAKPMTAKPQANMEFDESGQVRIAAGALADRSKKDATDSLSAGDRDAFPVVSSQVKPAVPEVASPTAKETSNTRADSADWKSSNGLRLAQGNLAGTILDPTGAVVRNAQVTMSGPVGAQTVTSDAEGRFAFHSISPGQYSIKAEASGFKSTEIQNVAVLDQKTSTLGLKLVPGAATETVEVSGAAVALTAEVAAAPPLQAAAEYGYAQKQVAQNARAENKNLPQRAKTAIALPQWTLSADGIVERSFDLGKTWQRVPIVVGTSFRTLCAIGAHVWAGGSSGTLYHSADSGASWVRLQPADSREKLASDITRIEFSDPAHGSVSTSNGEVWTTSDGGHTWRRK